MLSRVLSWIAAVLAGGVFGVAGTIAHSLTWASIPVGLVIGTIACGSLLIAIRALTHDRVATLAAGAGMLGLLFVISQRGPGGSVIVEDNLSGQIWVYLVAALVVLSVLWPALSRSRADEDVEPEATAPAAEHL